MSPLTKKIHWGTGTTNPLISQLAVVVDTEGDGRRGGKRRRETLTVVAARELMSSWFNHRKGS